MAIKSAMAWTSLIYFAAGFVGTSIPVIFLLAQPYRNNDWGTLGLTLAMVLVVVFLALVAAVAHSIHDFLRIRREDADSFFGKHGLVCFMSFFVLRMACSMVGSLCMLFVGMYIEKLNHQR